MTKENFADALSGVTKITGSKGYVQNAHEVTLQAVPVALRSEEIKVEQRINSEV